MASETSPGGRFKPHITDRIIAWVDGLRMSGLAFYALFFVTVGLFFTLLSWIEGRNPPGVFVPAYFLMGTWFLQGFYFNHFLVQSGGTTLKDFKPLLPPTKKSYEDQLYDFTHIPSRKGNIWLFIGILMGVGTAVYAFTNIPLALEIPTLYGSITAGTGFGLLFVAAYRSSYQLRIVHRWLNHIPNFSLYDLSSIYALALFPVKIVLMNIFVLWVNPALLILPGMFKNYVILGLWTFFSLLPAVVIYSPLQIIRKRLVTEKDELLKENSHHLETASQQLYQRMQSGEYEGMDEFEKGVSTLFAFRREIESISTWPWKPETIRAFITALLLPLGLWLLQLLLQRLFTS